MPFAVQAAEHALEDRSTHDRRADRENAAGERFGEGDDVGVEALRRAFEPVPAAAETRLDLVGDDHDAVLPAEVTQAAQEARRGNVDTALALNGLDDDRHHLVGTHLADDPLEGVQIAEGRREGAGKEGARPPDIARSFLKGQWPVLVS